MEQEVALLGPEGTYTHQAAKKHFGEFKPVFCSTIREVFNSETETKFVPVENSLGGGVADTVDLLRETDNKVTAEVVLPINHALISDSKLSEIETVKSHPQALSQSQNIISEHGWDENETDSTAKAVEEITENEAAIASEIAAEINDKPILKKEIQDTDTNITRFFVLNGDSQPKNKTSIILEPGEDRPGLLHSMLSCFAGHQVNLSNIQSRPTKNKLGDYYFYVEAQAADQRIEKAVKCLETYAEVKILGKYSEVE